MRRTFHQADPVLDSVFPVLDIGQQACSHQYDSIAAEMPYNPVAGVSCVSACPLNTTPAGVALASMGMSRQERIMLVTNVEQLQHELQVHTTS